MVKVDVTERFAEVSKMIKTPKSADHFPEVRKMVILNASDHFADVRKMIRIGA